MASLLSSSRSITVQKTSFDFLTILLLISFFFAVSTAQSHGGEDKWVLNFKNVSDEFPPLPCCNREDCTQANGQKGLVICFPQNFKCYPTAKDCARNCPPCRS